MSQTNLLYKRIEQAKVELLAKFPLSEEQKKMITEEAIQLLGAAKKTGIFQRLDNNPDSETIIPAIFATALFAITGLAEDFKNIIGSRTN